MEVPEQTPAEQQVPVDEVEKSDEKEVFFKASNTTYPKKLAGAVTHYVLDRKKVFVTAIGAGSVNQAVKGLTIARQYLAMKGIDILLLTSFQDVPTSIGSSEHITGIRFQVMERQ